MSKTFWHYSVGWVKIRNPIHDKYFLVDFVFGIRNYTESSHIEPYFAADTLYKIQLWTNEKPAPDMEPSDLSKVGSYKGCPQQNKALYENFQYYSWSQTKNLPGNDCLGWGSEFSPTLICIIYRYLQFQKRSFITRQKWTLFWWLHLYKRRIFIIRRILL